MATWHRKLLVITTVVMTAATTASASAGLLDFLFPKPAPAPAPAPEPEPAPEPVAGENVVKDGQFTESGVTSHFKTYKKGQTFGGWKVVEDDVDVKATYFQAPPAGGNTVDLNGSRSGRIEQKVTVPEGAEYILEFQLSGNWDGSPTTKDMDVYIGGKKVQDVKISKPSGWSRNNMQYQTVSIPYVGTGKEVTLLFDSDTSGAYGPVIGDVKLINPDPLSSAPKALATVPVPLPKGLNEFVKNKDAAILLGKSLFWDMQVGSDGKTACASCHFSAGVDNRITNTLYPGAPGSAFGPQRPDQEALEELADERFHKLGRANITLTKDEWPFHKVEDPTGDNDNNKILRSNPETVGSQGVLEKDFVKIVEGNPVDKGNDVADPEYNINGVSSRQITVRNAPTTINAVFHDRTFWDGRANRFFNGVNEFGDLDPNAKIWLATKSDDVDDKLAVLFAKYPWAIKFRKYFVKYTWLIRWFLGNEYNSITKLTQKRILLDNATLASQAVGPVISAVEMSWAGRVIPDVGRKMFTLKPLALQHVAYDDSVLGPYANPHGKGLKDGVSYQGLIQEAFADKWWNSNNLTPDGFTLMEANFSLFWGLAINLYEATLVADQTPYDAWASGDKNALTDEQLEGLRIFLNEGKCIDCHGGSEFAGATISDLRPIDPNASEGDGPIELMVMGNNKEAFYDGGFYNIGVRPTLEDLGVGADHPEFGPLSYTRQAQNGRKIEDAIDVPKGKRVAVDGAFKANTVRNAELTGPYMHTGGMLTLRQVVEFYTRGADFEKVNKDDLDPDVDGISELQGNDPKIDAVVAFIKSLTDDRVRFQRAPFDHPELIVPDGAIVENGVAKDINVHIPAVGKHGGEEIVPFEQRVH